MPRSFDISTDYAESVEAVLRAFSDEQYWHARLADSGVDDSTLDSMDVSDGVIDVVTTQVLRAHQMPALVTQFHRGDLRIRREERWEPIVDGSATATVTGSILDSPASLTGAAVLEPRGEYVPLTERLLAIYEDANEDPSAFRVTSRYVVATARR